MNQTETCGPAEDWL